MAIVKMNKFTLLSLSSKKEEVLKTLQNFRGVHLINLQNDELIESNTVLKTLGKESTGENLAKYEEALSKIKFSLEMLDKVEPETKGLKAVFEDKEEVSFKNLEKLEKESNWLQVCDFLKAKETKINELKNEETKLHAEIEALTKWTALKGDFKDYRNLKMTKAYIGTVPLLNQDSMTEEINANLKTAYFEKLGADNTDLYFLILVHISEEEECSEIIRRYSFSGLNTPHENSPSKIIKDCNNRIDSIKKELGSINGEIKSYVKHRKALRSCYEYFNSLVIRENASNKFLKSEKVTAICGWCPLDSNEKLIKMLNVNLEDSYYIDFEKPDNEDDVPIKLKNNAFASSFESVLEMYSLPTYKEIDPTPIFAIFYFIFFGMMLSDAGYGVLMALGSAFMLSKTKDKAKRNNYKLFLFAGLSTIIWGAIYGSWFGDLFPKYFGIKIPYLIEPTTNVINLMAMSVIFGVIHILLGLGIKGYLLIRDKEYKVFVYDVVTWYAVLIGFIVVILGLQTIGWILVIAGIVGLLLTQGRENPTLIGKLGGGLYGVYGITGYFGDIVSYLRLLALGLTTGFIANAMNLIVNLIGSISPILTFTLVPVLFILFHVFNLALNAVGTYVHTARLQYLEFFNKFYEGGGTKYVPLDYSEEFMKIKNEN